jgi:WD40-like Beta Propeller Repeat
LPFGWSPLTRNRRKAYARVAARFWIFVCAAVVLLGLLGWGGFKFFRSRSAVQPAVSSGEWVQLTDFDDSAVSPALSPDGRILAFVRSPSTFFGPGQIEAMVLPNGEPVELTHDDGGKMSPKFPPDGSTIAYTVAPLDSDPWKWNTWTVPVLGGQPRLMLPNAVGLTWIDPSNILFSEILIGYHMAVATSNADRSDSRFVYVPPRERGMAHRSAISPDHKWVLAAEMNNGGWLPCRLVSFTSQCAPHQGRSYLWLASLDFRFSPLEYAARWTRTSPSGTPPDISIFQPPKDNPTSSSG